MYPGEEHTMITTPSNEEHKLFRRLLSPAFGISYLNKLGPLMMDVLESLFSKCDSTFKDGEKECVVDIWRLCNAFAFDVIGTTAFGSSFECIEKESHPIVDEFKNRFKYFSLKIVVPAFLLPLFKVYKEAKVYLMFLLA